MAMLGHYFGPKDTTGYYPWLWIYAGAWAVYNHFGFVGESHKKTLCPNKKT